VNPLGLCDLDRNVRPVGAAYKQIIHDWRNVLPTQRLITQEYFEMPTNHLVPRKPNGALPARPGRLSEPHKDLDSHP